MNPFDIFIVCISWKTGSKSRSVLVIHISGSAVSAYPITTQYENKSKAIQAKYFKINDWLQVGLDRQSYVDTGTLLDIPLAVIKTKQPIGNLSIADKQRLLVFLT